MFYTNKKESLDVLELIYSEPGITIVVDQQQTMQAGSPIGKIIKEGKKQFKRSYKKSSKNHILIEETPEEIKNQIIETFLTDKEGIIRYTDEYLERKSFLDRKDFFSGISQSEYEESLEKYADPVATKKPMTRKDLLRAKEALLNAYEDKQ